MDWRIEVTMRAGLKDARGEAIQADVRDMGIETVQAVSSVQVYLIEAAFDEPEARRIAEKLLCDPVAEEFRLGRIEPPAGLGRAHVIEVYLKPGVMDPVAGSAARAIGDLGLSAESVRTARKYVLIGELDDRQVGRIANELLANDCIETVAIDSDEAPPSPHAADYVLRLRRIAIRELSDEALTDLSKKSDFFLNLEEMQAIREHFRRLDRDPTDVELETLAQTWSEHCVHKTLKGLIDYQGAGLLPDSVQNEGHARQIDNLLGSTIAKATRELDRDWCVSVFVDNAGVVTYEGDWCVCFKVETHNHPSAIEPYGGAATGIGGVIRDVLGTGLGGKPIANTDVFCFAEPDLPAEDLPRGVLHPRRIMKGVVAGVRDYGNRMGIPTLNGALYFDRRYLGNPLVYCGTLGLIPRDKVFKKAEPGDLIVCVGGRTGRDGIHGATFSSGELTDTHADEFSHAVQIGNPITEKKMTDTILEARDRGLFRAMTDCGAGGLSSAVGEMGEELGADVQLDKVPLKYQGLSYTEIWISEAQERMVLAVPPEHLDELMTIFHTEDVEATVIGTFGSDKKLRLFYEGKEVGDLGMGFLHGGVPRRKRRAQWLPKKASEPDLPEPTDCNDLLTRLLGMPNIASKEWVIRQYDHEVQAATVIKPLVGVADDGPSDAAVIHPLAAMGAGAKGSKRALALGCGCNPRYGDLDPYAMALAGIDEAIRNVVCVGGDPKRVALLDNFSWGNCEKPDLLGGLVRACFACYHASKAFEAPFISGKDSLNNEFSAEDGSAISIPQTLLISALTIVPDVDRCITMDAKRPGNWLFILGQTRNELGGSHYYGLHDESGAHVPWVNLAEAPGVMAMVHQLIQEGLIVSCHDLSEGGLAVAAAEMAFAGGCGLALDLRGLPKSPDVHRVDTMLFSESCSRFLVEVPPEKLRAFLRMAQTIHCGQIGRVTDDPRLTCRTPDGRTCLDAPLSDLKAGWQATFQW